MPTIIDSLILELKLDPSGFSEGQRRAAENLRQLELGADRAGQRVERSGASVVSFFRTLESPLSGIKRHFEEFARAPQAPQRGLAELAAQGTRTGAAVQAGALEGAAGLRVLGIAGLGAFAAITAVDKAMKVASETSQKVFGAGVSAAGAGVPVDQFTAASQVLLRKGVPEAETQQFLEKLQIMQQQSRAGIPGAGAALGMLQGTYQTAKIGGVDLYNDDPLTTMTKVAAAFSQMSVTEAIAMGQAIGLSDTFAKSLHDLGAAELEAQEAAQRQSAVTKANVTAADDLTAAQGRLATAWERLERLSLDVWFDKLYNQLAKVINGIAVINDPASTRGQVMDEYGKIPFTLEWFRRKLGFGPSATAGPGATAGPSAGTATSGNWEVMHNNFAGMRIPGVNAGPLGGGFQSFATPEEGIQAEGRLLQAYQDRHGLNTLRGIISRWAPSSENDTEALIARASRVTGFGADQPLDLHDTATLSRVVEAMIRGEQGGQLPVPGGVSTIDRALGLIRNGTPAGNVGTRNQNINIGDVHVHTQATDADGTGRAVVDQLGQRLRHAVQANTGLE